MFVVYFDEILSSIISGAHPSLQRNRKIFSQSSHATHCMAMSIRKAIFMPSLDLFLSGQTYKFGLYIHISGGCGINGTNNHIPFGHKMSPFVEICITTFYYFAPFLLVFVSPSVLRDHITRNRAHAAPLIPTVM